MREAVSTGEDQTKKEQQDLVLLLFGFGLFQLMSVETFGLWDIGCGIPVEEEFSEFKPGIDRSS
ncbi:hypothetical protein Mal48_11310 [Thalassoglobus polymorphus]|uniref:Uncharacterized protein n=1 Tax=Thalassoglobus polymorphus TaxID=2527994 RepID=A0A517QJW6_9PLAN|nr:hypothetical protein Mal48_11310 [Thalassoglobus polymorphus]